MIFTQSNEKTALTCLSQNDWKLDVSTDNFFQNPDLYHSNLKGVLDKKRLEQLYNRYRGKCHIFFSHLCLCWMYYNNICNLADAFIQRDLVMRAYIFKYGWSHRTHYPGIASTRLLYQLSYRGLDKCTRQYYGTVSKNNSSITDCKKNNNTAIGHA